MKLFNIFFLIIIVHFASASTILDSFNRGFDKVKNVFNDDNKNENEEDPVEDYLITKNRTEDVCSFTKLEKKIEVLPDLEECKKINERFKQNSNFDFINYFGELFNELKMGIDSIKFPNVGGKMNTIFFVGNTGSGKSTLVQIIGGDNNKIFSKAPNEFSNDFIIVDNSKIGVDTVNSQTLYPELLIDPETRYVLCDNPGFRDTRSSVHEIIATYGIRKVLKNTKKIKIVIVSTHSSLKSGMYRDDFPNLLKHITDLFYNVDRYKEYIYLIGTKAENTFVTVKGKPSFISDHSIINGVAHFLAEVRRSMNENLLNITEKNKKEYFQKSIKMIDFLIKKDNGSYKKINILRRPPEEGPLSDISIIQDERNSIREMLLNDDNMVEVEENDFGFPLTDSAVVYLNEIFKKMNSYVTKLSDIIVGYIINYCENLINSITDISETITVVRKMRSGIKRLSNGVGEAKNPGQYADIINNFSKKYNLGLECLTLLKNVSSLNDFLVNLEDLSDSTKYTPVLWSMSFKKMSDLIENKVEQLNFLNDIYKLTSSYKFQRNRHSSFNSDNSTNSETSIDEILLENNLRDRFDSVLPDSFLYHNIKEIFSITINHKQNVICANGTLLFTDYFIILSELNYDTFKSCNDYSRIVILAFHTIFIDQDLTNEWFKGKDFTIISPVWEVIGTRTLSVDGVDGDRKLPKASSGTIGKYGGNGKPGGKFAGIGMEFVNGQNLKITANGGKGGDGQDGGDGVDGTHGRNADLANAVNVETKPTIYVIVNFKEEKLLSEGSRGQSGGDAGAGGAGGYGGNKGSAVVYNIGSDLDEILVIAEDGKRGNNGLDGKPGRGSVKGCDKEVVKTTTYILFLPVSTSASSDFINCGGENPSGKVKHANQLPRYENTSISNNDSPVCIHIMNFQNHYQDEYHSRLSDGITKKFITDMKLTKY